MAEARIRIRREELDRGDKHIIFSTAAGCRGRCSTCNIKKDIKGNEAILNKLIRQSFMQWLRIRVEHSLNCKKPIFGQYAK